MFNNAQIQFRFYNIFYYMNIKAVIHNSNIFRHLKSS